MTDEQLNARFDAIGKRFNDVVKLLMQLQGDLRMFYRELGYIDHRLDSLEERNNP